MNEGVWDQQVMWLTRDRRQMPKCFSGKKKLQQRKHCALKYNSLCAKMIDNIFVKYL
jgi:hypothetical protein